MDYVVSILTLGMFYMKVVGIVVLAIAILLIVFNIGVRIWDYIEDKKWQRENTESK